MTKKAGLKERQSEKTGSRASKRGNTQKQMEDS